MKPIKIFRVGNHTDMSGVTRNYTREMLSECVAAYSPEVHEAPFVLGHPKHDDPALGWADHLELDDDGILWAYPKKVDAEFAENVNAEKHNKVSSSFYLPDSANNPTPGKLYLRHVGFLGAMPPAVKGLGSVKFAEDEQGVVEFGDWGFELAADLFRKWRDYLIDDLGQEKADLIAPNWMIESLREYANASPKDVEAAFSEHYKPSNSVPQPEETKTPREIELEQQLAQANAAMAAKENAEKEASFSEFVESLVAGGKMPPKLKAGAIELLKAAGQQDQQVVNFAEGEVSFSEGIQSFLNQVFDSPIVNFSEKNPKRDVDPKINQTENPLIADAKSRSA
ncbi:peptidase [Acinetobacter junii]|uniref:peptidase n=1 Tax=Acinetobacter junii TaxID=40215 RepID=UPI00100E9EDA|nr:peptidase [Acinetobacter junii]RXS99025.1 peptidase [Acinetobacter junii]